MSPSFTPARSTALLSCFCFVFTFLLFMSANLRHRHLNYGLWFLFPNSVITTDPPSTLESFYTASKSIRENWNNNKSYFKGVLLSTIGRPSIYAASNVSLKSIRHNRNNNNKRHLFQKSYFKGFSENRSLIEEIRSRGWKLAWYLNNLFPTYNMIWYDMIVGNMECRHNCLFYFF